MIFRLACIVVLLHSSSTAYASEWQVDHENSKLGFVATYEGIPFKGWFKKFSARIVFDPGMREASLFDVIVDIASIDSDSRDRDEGMLGKEWFFAQKFAKASFFAETFNRISDARFTATGDLTIKGITKRIVLPFNWSTPKQGKDAELTSELKLNRTDFQVGSGEWATDPTIGYEVKVLVDLFLTRK